jgi:hypothetical protein
MRQRQPRDRNETHLAFIRTLPCLLCNNNISTEAAHVRMADRSVAKPMTGIATKCDDRFTVPLCGTHHRQQHEHGNEGHWWLLSGIDPIKAALALYSVSGDYERGCEIVSACCERVAA